MKLSVCCITYNQEAYICQALEGMLMQQTTFDFEIVVGEDRSTDQTMAIIERYQQLHPSRIRVLRHEENVGARKNFAATLLACKGEYIAICEGDDYWTDPLKLQKQVDFLDTHPDYKLCFHNSSIYYQDNGESKLSNTEQQPVTTTIVELIENWYIMTCSMVFRNTLTSFPGWFTYAFNTDYALQLLLLAEGGKIGYLPDVMCVYRKHTAGESARTWGHDPYFWLLFLFNKFDAETHHRYTPFIQKRKEEITKILAKYYRNILVSSNGNYSLRIKNLVRYYSMKMNAPGFYYKKFLQQKNLQ